MNRTAPLDSCGSNESPPPYRAIFRLRGIAFELGEPFEAWVNEGEQVVAIEPDHADRGYWLTTADGERVLYARDPMVWLVSEAEWQADLAADRAAEAA